MSWLGGWLNQTVSWEPLTGDDDWEGRTYGPALSIRARKEAASRNIPGTPEIRQGNLIWAKEGIAVGDKIDGEIIQAIEESFTNMDGSTDGYKVRTEP